MRTTAQPCFCLQPTLATQGHAQRKAQLPGDLDSDLGKVPAPLQSLFLAAHQSVSLAAPALHPARAASLAQLLLLTSS
jgi:hypothetical protein